MYRKLESYGIDEKFAEKVREHAELKWFETVMKHSANVARFLNAELSSLRGSVTSLREGGDDEEEKEEDGKSEASGPLNHVLKNSNAK